MDKLNISKKYIKETSNMSLNGKMRNKGITIIALIVIITVLIIIAGVTISAAIGENGLIEITQRMKNDTQIKEIINEIKIEISKDKMKYGTQITKERLEVILENYGTIEYEEDGETLKGIITKEDEIFISIDKVINKNDILSD